MPTKEEVAAVVAGIRLIEVEEKACAPDPAKVVSPTTTDVDCSGAKERLLSGYINAQLRATIIDLRKAQVDDTRDDVNKESDDGDETVDTSEVSEADSFDVEVIEEHCTQDDATSATGVAELDTYSQVVKDDAWCSPTEETCSVRQPAGINFLCPKNESESQHLYTKIPIDSPDYNAMERCATTDASLQKEDDIKPAKRNSIIQNIVEDFTPNKGDQKILRAIGRTATVNAAVLLTAATGGAAGAVGFVTGGAITSKRLFDGLAKQDDKEVTKSLAVYGCATGASIAGQAVAGALMIGVAGASLPLAGVVAFGVGCCSGITAGALSEWTVDSVMDKVKGIGIGRRTMEKQGKNNGMERCKSDGALLDRTEDRSSQE